MKTNLVNLTSLGLVLLSFGLFGGCSKRSSATNKSFDRAIASSDLKSFVAAQETQARTLAASEGITLSPTSEAFFQALQQGDWETISNRFLAMQKHLQTSEGGEEHSGSWRSAALDAYGAVEAFALGGEKYSMAFGRDVINSIPDGSIYFGGNDAGRFLITALSESHTEGKPFFTLTQNALADGTYLKYLQSMYDGKIYTPTAEDSANCFNEYYQDAIKRYQHDQQFPKEPKQIKPGEGVNYDSSNGRVQISGQVAVMQINGLLAKLIFNKNPNRECYVVESFPLDWMYPYLEPHELIMKIDRQSPAELTTDIVQRDFDYWMKYIQPMIGDWLKPDTSVSEVAAFADKIFARQDLSGFQGDQQFIQIEVAQKNFSKLRASIGGLYLWRMRHAANASEKGRMAEAADFAFRQAWALCPYSSETVFRYIDLLASQNRVEDAILVAETAAKMPQMKGQDGTLREVIANLKRSQKTK